MIKVTTLKIILSICLLLLIVTGCTAAESTPTTTDVSPTTILTATATPTATSPATATAKPTLTPTATPADEARPFPPSTPSVLLFKEDHFFRASLSDDSQLPLFTSPERASGEIAEAWRGLFVNPPRISPDGRWMVERGADTWWLVNLQTGETVVQGESHLHQHTTSWAPDSSRFAYLDSQQHLCIYELSTETTSCPFEDALLRNLRWSPDGTHIAALESDEVCCDGAVWLISLPDGEGEVIGQYTSAAEPPPWGNLAWTPEGSSLLIKNTGETPATWYTLASGETRSLPAPAISLSPDGDVVLYDLATDSALAVGGLETQETWTLPHDPACGDPLELYNWAWSPEGHRLAYVTPCPDGTSTLYLVDAAREELLWSHVLPDLEAWILRWSPDGKSLLIDDDRYQPPSPIWRLSVEGDGAPEMIVERGLLVDVVPTTTHSVSTAPPPPTPIAVARLCPPASSEAEWECQDLEIAIKSQFPDDIKLRKRYSITDPPIGALEVDVWLPSDADLTTWLKKHAPNLFPVREPNGAVGGHPTIFWVTDPPHSSFNALVSDGTYIYKLYYVITCHEDGLPAVHQMLDTFRFSGEPAIPADIPEDVCQQALEVCE